MCGRLSSKSQAQVIAKLYQANLTLDNYWPSHNVAPTERTPIVQEEGPEHTRTVSLAMFGIPTTMPGKSFNLINLQSEKAGNRQDFRERRCVIPADGFYEWERISEKEKQPHYFYPPEGMFSLAGVWKETEKGLAFAIFTTTPNRPAQLGRLHPPDAGDPGPQCRFAMARAGIRPKRAEQLLSALPREPDARTQSQQGGEQPEEQESRLHSAGMSHVRPG